LDTIAASALIIFFNRDSIYLAVLRMLGRNLKASWPKVTFRECVPFHPDPPQARSDNRLREERTEVRRTKLV
jgi:hypothetical protein